jgi:hypothetical protein
MNPQKLLNYQLQNLETSLNIIILWEMFKLLKGKKTKLVLYTYDSFLLDFNKEDSDILQNILEIFKSYNLSIQIKQGVNYQEMF